MTQGEQFDRSPDRLPAMTMRSAIPGVSHYTPSRVVTSEDLAKLMTTSDEWIAARTGIRERRHIEAQGDRLSGPRGAAAEDGAL